MSLGRGAALLFACLAVAAPAAAQRFSFERSFDAAEITELDASTIRGKIDVAPGKSGTIEVLGTVTVRNIQVVAADPVAIARDVTDHPPIDVVEHTLRLRPPADSVAQRAVTVDYRVRVPPGTRVKAVSDSGVISLDRISAPAYVRTQSSAIALTDMSGVTEVATGSGAVSIHGASAGLTITTESSSIRGRNVRGPLSIRTQSGEVDASLTGDGAVDVRTGSSAITVDGVKGALRASSESGRVRVSGSPAAPWQLWSGSGSLDVTLAPAAAAAVDASTGSGSVRSEGEPIVGASSQRSLRGALRGGGPSVRVESRSGSVRIRAEP